MTHITSDGNRKNSLPKSLARFDLHQQRYYKKLQSQPLFNMVNPVIEETHRWKETATWRN